MKYFENEDKKSVEDCSGDEKLCFVNAMCCGDEFEYFDLELEYFDLELDRWEKSYGGIFARNIYRVPRPAMTVNEAVEKALLLKKDLQINQQAEALSITRCVEIMKLIEGYKPKAGDQS